MSDLDQAPGSQYLPDVPTHITEIKGALEVKLDGYEQVVKNLEDGYVYDDDGYSYLAEQEGIGRSDRNKGIDKHLKAIETYFPEAFDEMGSRHEDLKKRLKAVKPDVWERLFGQK